MAISRQTWMTLWLMLTLGVATWSWVATHPDDCARYLRGDSSLPGTQEVDAARGSVTVPCQVWFPRQRPAVQALVALDVILGVVFGISLGVDVRRAREARGMGAG